MLTMQPESTDMFERYKAAKVSRLLRPMLEHASMGSEQRVAVHAKKQKTSEGGEPER